AGVRPPEVVVALSEHQARISSVHERSLALGTATHQRFLRSQWQAEAALRAAHAVFGGRRSSLTRSDPVPPVQASTTPSNVIPFPGRGAPARRRPGQHAQVAVVDGIRCDEASMRAWAGGRRSEASGPRYACFDEARKMPRMPAPPFAFISRIASVVGPQCGMQPGSGVAAVYDVPADAWYWWENGYPVMPLSAMIE